LNKKLHEEEEEEEEEVDVIVDAYQSHFATLRSPNCKYVYWDFHEYCKGNNFSNVAILLQKLAPDFEMIGNDTMSHRNITAYSSCRMSLLLLHGASTERESAWSVPHELQGLS
jgi:hypothetical protein